MLRLYQLVYFVCLFIALPRSEGLDKDFPFISDTQTHSTHKDDSSSGKGFMMCAGNHMIPDVLKMIWQLKYQWKSTNSIAIAHCGEISEDNQQLLRHMHPGVHIENICEPKEPFNMTHSHAARRLRGFFCKVAAMIQSPFPETMLLDLDVVWLESPDLLFNSTAYKNTGALYFRDRNFPANENHKTDDEILLNLFHSKGIGTTDEAVRKLARANGISFYWMYMASKLPGGRPFPHLGELQDSSVVLLNRPRHPRTLAAMVELLPTFDYGYGDKELFWVASTLAREPFTLSPFLAGQYGDCHGVLLHYHPDEAAADPVNARPLYINAEYFVEKETTVVGAFLRPVRTTPVLASANMSKIVSMYTWDGNHHRGDASCTCMEHQCVPFSPRLTEKLLYAQWLTLTMRMDRTGDPTADCQPALLQHAPALAHMFATAVKPTDCYFLGCPALPVVVNFTGGSAPPRETTTTYCDPMHFLRVPPANLNELAAPARDGTGEYNQSPVPENTPVQVGIGRELYLYQNGELHLFNNWAAFVSRGYDLDQVVRISHQKFTALRLGAQLNR